MVTKDLDDAKRRAAGVRMLLLDVDGVMTDGGIILIGEKGEAKRFDVQDGMGVTLARAAGLKVGIITSRNSAVVRRRAAELRIDELCQSVSRKEDALDSLLGKHGLDPSQVAYVGDDIVDAPVMKRVGLPIAVRNARPELKRHCICVTRNPGGHGAVREVVDWLLDAMGRKDAVYEEFSSLRGKG